MYETMLYRETAHTMSGQPSSIQEFTRIWQAAEKIVFSNTLASVSSARTRIERNFDPGMVRQLKSATEHDMTVGGADLAGQAIKAGLVDELQLFLVPVVVGGGKRALPDGVRADLELLDTQRFASGAVYLRYRPSAVNQSLSARLSCPPHRSPLRVPPPACSAAAGRASPHPR
jgi:dihydrofolate reductase